MSLTCGLPSFSISNAPSAPLAMMLSGAPQPGFSSASTITVIFEHRCHLFDAVKKSFRVFFDRTIGDDDISPHFFGKIKALYHCCGIFGLVAHVKMDTDGFYCQPRLGCHGQKTASVGTGKKMIVDNSRIIILDERRLHVFKPEFSGHLKGFFKWSTMKHKGVERQIVCYFLGVGHGVYFAPYSWRASATLMTSQPMASMSRASFFTSTELVRAFWPGA